MVGWQCLLRVVLYAEQAWWTMMDLWRRVDVGGVLFHIIGLLKDAMVFDVMHDLVGEV